MVETRRSQDEAERRGTPVPEWEVFVRGERTEPLHHVGSVAAATAEEAHEQASSLFDWHAVDLWLCPAESVERYTTRPSLEAVGDESPTTADGEPGDDQSSTVTSQ